MRERSSSLLDRFCISPRLAGIWLPESCIRFIQSTILCTNAVSFSVYCEFDLSRISSMLLEILPDRFTTSESSSECSLTISAISTVDAVSSSLPVRSSPAVSSTVESNQKNYLHVSLEETCIRGNEHTDEKGNHDGKPYKPYDVHAFRYDDNVQYPKDTVKYNGKYERNTNDGQGLFIIVFTELLFYIIFKSQLKTGKRIFLFHCTYSRYQLSILQL